MSELCTALTHDFGDNIEPCKRPVLRAGYCAGCLPYILKAASKKVNDAICELQASGLRIMELEDPNGDARMTHYNDIEFHVLDTLRAIKEKV